MPKPPPDCHEQLLAQHEALILELTDEVDQKVQLWSRIARLRVDRNALLKEIITLKQEIHHLTGEFIAGRGALIVAETQLEQLTKEVELLRIHLNPRLPELEIITDGKEPEHNRNS